MDVREMGPLEAKKNKKKKLKYIKNNLYRFKYPATAIVTLIWQQNETLTAFLGSYILCSSTEGFSVSDIRVSGLDALDLVPGD